MKRITAVAAFFIFAGVVESNATLLVRELWDNNTNVTSNLKGVGNGTTSFGFAGPGWIVNPSTNANFLLDTGTDVDDWMIGVYPMLPSRKDAFSALTLRPGNTNGYDSTSYAVRTLATASRINFNVNATNYFSARIIKRGLWYNGYGQDDSAVGIGFANSGNGHFVGAGFTRTVAANGGGGYLTSDGSLDIGDTVYITTGLLNQAGYANHPEDSAGPYFVRAYGPLQQVTGYIDEFVNVNGGLLVGRIITTTSGNAQMDVRTYVAPDGIDADPSGVIWDVSYSFTETLQLSQLLVWMHGTNSPVMIDAIRVATTWAEAVGIDILGAPSVSPTNVVYSGTPVTFSALTSVNPEDGWYQWLRGGTNIPGSDGFGTNFASFVIPSPVPGDSGNYSLIFSNYYGLAITSTVQSLTVLLSSSPIITVQPVAGSRYVSSPSFTMSVTTVGTPPFYYQWKHIVGGVTNAVSGQTNRVLALSGITTNDGGNYLVTITNVLGSTNSAPATLTVVPVNPGTYASAVLANSPYAYWPMNETNGTVYYDFYNGHDGFTLDPTNMTLGANGAAAAGFAGPHLATFIPNNGQFARVNMPTLPGYSNVMTFCGWIYTPSAPTLNGFMFNRDPASGGYGNAFGLEFVALTNVVSGLTTNTCGVLGYQWAGYTWNSGLTVPLLNWTFVALVVSNNQATIYMGTNSSPLTVNNAALPSMTDTSFPGGNYSNTNALFLGRTGWPWAEYPNQDNAWANANITMSDAAVFYSALSASNIYNIYTSAVGELITTTNSTGNMVLSWPFGTLQAAGKVEGIYTNVPSAVSPYTVPTTAAANFYRVKQ